MTCATQKMWIRLHCNPSNLCMDLVQQSLWNRPTNQPLRQPTIWYIWYIYWSKYYMMTESPVICYHSPFELQKKSAVSVCLNFFNQTSCQQYLNLKWVNFMQTHVNSFKLFAMKRLLIKETVFCTYKVVKIWVNKHYVDQSLYGRFFMSICWLLATLDLFGFLIHEEWLSFILTLKLFTCHQTNI